MTGPNETPLSTSSAEVAARYRARAEHHERARAEAARLERRLAHFRLLSFGVAVAAIIWMASSTGFHAVAVALAAIGAVAFAVLVAVHRRARERAWREEQLRDVNAIGERRVLRDWDALPPPWDFELDPSHPYAADLDVVGHASLARLLDVVSAAPGRPTLLAWLLAPAPSADVIRERQRAVAELATQADARAELAVLARAAGELSPHDYEHFLRWAEGEVWLRRRPAVLWLARALPAVTLGAVALQLAGQVGWSAWAVPVLVGAFVTTATRRRVAGTMRRVAADATGLRAHAALLACASGLPAEAPLLRRIRARLATGAGAHRELARLERIVRSAEVRYSPMLHLPLQALFLWDLHVVARLERWQLESGARVRDWLAALGEAEALAALATLAHDNPRWAMPEVRDDGVALIEAAALAHPLLPDATRVANDATVGPPGTVLLVTGSNMSGKSTLLRSIGTNVVLAQAGGPVCAARLRMPLVSLHTSIRVQDSLEQGLSLFMAELRHLKRIVDAARGHEGGRVLLFLLDEVLHGTNSAERRVAARTILQHLLRAGAIGAITTHDLALAADGDLAAAARPVHFTEAFARGPDGLRMTFDYVLRPGLATSTNALRLLEMIGLGAERG